MKKLAILSLLIICSFAASAQTDFRPGYVITNDNDTIYGEIDYRGSILMSKQCTFRSDRKNKIVYTPRDIAAYRFIDSKYFVSRPVMGSEWVFLEVLVKGELDVYYYKDRYREHYYVQKSGMPLTEIPYSDKTITIDGREYERNNSHLGVLSFYTKEAPGLQQDLKKMKKLTPDNMIGLAEKYHNAVCDDYSCVVYQTVLPKISVAVELAGGAFRTYRNGETAATGGKWGGMPAVYAHISFPRVSERFFLRTGFAAQIFPDAKWWNNSVDEYYYYHPVAPDYINYPYPPLYTGERPRSHFLKIPFQAEYQSVRGVVRPKLACGITYYLPGSSLFSCMAGVNVFLNKHVALSVNYDLEAFTKGRVLCPEFRGGQSIQAGLYVAF